MSTFLTKDLKVGDKINVMPPTGLHYLQIIVVKTLYGYLCWKWNHTSTIYIQEVLHNSQTVHLRFFMEIKIDLV